MLALLLVDYFMGAQIGVNLGVKFAVFFVVCILSNVQCVQSFRQQSHMTI
jgi:hypothetical protein